MHGTESNRINVPAKATSTSNQLLCILQIDIQFTSAITRLSTHDLLERAPISILECLLNPNERSFDSQVLASQDFFTRPAVFTVLLPKLHHNT